MFETDAVNAEPAVVPNAVTFTVPPVAIYSFWLAPALSPIPRTHTPQVLKSASVPLIVNVPAWTVVPANGPVLSHSSICTKSIGLGNAVASRYQCTVPPDIATLHICAFVAVSVPASGVFDGREQFGPPPPLSGPPPPGPGGASPAQAAKMTSKAILFIRSRSAIDMPYSTHRYRVTYS